MTTAMNQSLDMINSLILRYFLGDFFDWACFLSDLRVFVIEGASFTAFLGLSVFLAFAMIVLQFLSY